MTAAKLETWTWVLIYGGLLSLCLGVFVLMRGGLLGWPLVVLGVLAVALGALFIVLRARIAPPAKK
jgi:apolipoprotein N-acyltransferase